MFKVTASVFLNAVGFALGGRLLKVGIVAAFGGATGINKSDVAKFVPEGLTTLVVSTIATPVYQL